jgi:hypothetical protein
MHLVRFTATNLVLSMASLLPLIAAGLSLEVKYASTSGWFRQIEAGALSSKILTMRAERLVQLSPKKFQSHDLVHHFADPRPVDILRTRFSSDPSIQKAGL